MTKEELIKAVRDDKLVGRGSCTSIDECYTDDELVEAFGMFETVEEVIKEARESEGMHWEQGLNARCGEDDDPQLLAYNEWQAKVAAERKG